MPIYLLVAEPNDEKSFLCYWESCSESQRAMMTDFLASRCFGLWKALGKKHAIIICIPSTLIFLSSLATSKSLPTMISYHNRHLSNQNLLQYKNNMDLEFGSLL